MNTTTGLSSSPPPLLAFAPGGAAAPGERFLSYSGQFLEPPAAAIWVNFFWVSFACHFWVSVRSLACKISCGDFGVFSEARIGFTLVLVLSNISLWDLFGLVFEFFVGKRKYTRFFFLASSCLLLDYIQRGTLAFSGSTSIGHFHELVSLAFGVQSFALSFRSKKNMENFNIVG